MQRLFLFIILVFGVNVAFAQLEVKEGTFKKVDGFVNINIDKMYDDNNKPYAVLKIKTENINDKQRRELSFGGDAQTFFEIEYKDGEVWLYISYYATFLKISHPDLSSTEFWFPFDMEPKRGYELTLVNKPAVDEEKIISLIDERLGNSSDNVKEYGFIIIKTTPVDGATVYIDGKEMEMKTPFVSEKIEAGPHRIKIVNSSYQDYVTVVKLDKDEIKNLEIKLVKNQSKKTDGATKKQHTTSIREKGWVLKPLLCAGTSIKFQISADYMFGPKFELGGGFGYINKFGDVSGLMPYVDVSWCIINRKVSPFINCNLGWYIPLTVFEDYYSYSSLDYDINYYSYEYESCNGLYISFCAGINYKHSSYGISIGTVSEYYYDTSNIHVDTTRWYLGLTYSYMIHLGKKQ